MKKYDVSLYYHTSITVTVEAEDEESAIENAREEICDSKYNKYLLDNLDEDSDPDVYEVNEDEQ